MMHGPRTRVGGAWLAGLAVAALALTGCSSESSPGPASSATSTSPAASHGSYAHCLEEHGVPAPAGPVSTAPPGVDAGAWQKAEQACASLAPGPGPG